MKFDSNMSEIVKHASSMCVITGAGISAESSIPTFRGAGGLWKNYKAEELATPSAFRRDPSLVWEWYDWRRGICLHAEPNAAHHAVAELENIYDSFLLITQNVDGLHGRAGSKKLEEIHGNIHTARCTDPRCVPPFLLGEHPLKESPPSCPKCGKLARPHIVWFGENYDMRQLLRCEEALCSCDVVLVIGTSGAVSTPVHLAYKAKQSGAMVIEINPEASQVGNFADFSFAAKAGEFMPEFISAVKDK